MKDKVDPEIAKQFRALDMMSGEAFNKNEAAADEINRGFRIGKPKKLPRSACPTLVEALMVTCLLVVVAPVSGLADNVWDRDLGHGRENNDKGIRAEIAAVLAQVTSLQSTVSALQTANTNLRNEVNSLQASNANLQNQVNSLQTSNTAFQGKLSALQSNPVFKLAKLGEFVSVLSGVRDGVNGPHIYFTGANIHIVSGSTRTDDNGAPTGLGNLIIGYDEDPGMVLGAHSPPLLLPGERGGSHNLVIGVGNRFTKDAFGGLVAGEGNTIANEGASVLGGFYSTASGQGSVVLGGWQSIASGLTSTVLSASYSTASGYGACVIAGAGGNKAMGQGSVVLGGQGSTASGFYANILGGQNHTASGQGSVVLGGRNNTAGGATAVVLGNENVTANTPLSIVPKAPFP